MDRSVIQLDGKLRVLLCVIAAAILFALIASAQGYQPIARKEPPPKSLFVFDLDTLVVCLNDCELQNAHVKSLANGASVNFTDWFHVGPITASTNELGRGTIFYGTQKPQKDLPFPPSISDMEYEGKLMHRNLTSGFPMQLELTFTFKDLVNEKTLITFAKTVTFTKENELVVVRSEDGGYLLMLRLVRRTGNREFQRYTKQEVPDWIEFPRY